MPFLDTLAVHYGAGLNVVDFVGEPERSRVAINRWVEEKTEDRIKDLMPRGVVSTRTRMILVNAVYFEAGWAAPFHPDRTEPAPFTRLDGSSVDVMTMNELSERPFVKADGYEAVELPYDGKDLSMLVVAPTAGTFASFESSLTAEKVLDVFESLETKALDLYLPKTKTEGAFALRPALGSLGMKRAFDEEAADFSGLSSTEELFIKDVVHKTFLQIDERGTVAAAATGVGFSNSSAPPPPPVMKIDRPFLAAIIDRPTKTLLFLGRILEPKR